MQPVRLLVTAADGSEVLQLGFGAIRKDVEAPGDIHQLAVS